MRILIEAHHPAHVHFWKYPVRELLARGHRILMVARDRDVMRDLLNAYQWIPCIIPKRRKRANRIPLMEMISRQWTMIHMIQKFRPAVVASLMGSYAQSAKLMGCRNIVFTDSEFQHFNHCIAHPFADEIHTPYCFYKSLGSKQHTYHGIHELCFLDSRRFHPDSMVLNKYGTLKPGEYLLLRLSAWNTLHDINHEGLGAQVSEFAKKNADNFQIVISAEEDRLPEDLRPYAMQFAAEDFHHILAYAGFVLTEGASTASEAGCLGVPTVYVNSTEPRGYLQMLEQRYQIVRSYTKASLGIPSATAWLSSLPDFVDRPALRMRILKDHDDVCSYVVNALLKQ